MRIGAIDLEETRLILFLASFGFKQTGDLPIFNRHKSLDFAFTFNNQPQCHGLHPTRGKVTLYLCPKDWAQAVTYQTVEDAARLLGVHQIHIDLPGLGKRVRHRFFGDFMENDPFHLVRFHLSGFHHMPGDRFAFTIWVSGEENFLASRGLCRDFRDQLFFFIRYAILGCEIVLHIHT